MRKTSYIWLVIITVTFLLFTPVFLMVCGFLLPPQYDSTFLGELKYKCEALEQTKGSRIVFLGGSSVAFGVDSALVEKELPEYSVINFGMYAALGTKVMLDLSIDSFRSGDIVILSPEQEVQTLSNYFNGEAAWQALDGAFPLLARIDHSDLGRLAGHFPSFAARKFDYYIGDHAPNPGGVYSRDAFNQYGDIASKECTYNIMAYGYDKNTPIRFEAAMLDRDFTNYLNAFADKLKERGVTVWYRFCPMNGAAVEEGSDVDGYYELLQSRLNFYVIGDPKKSILEKEWFYDTNFHLNKSGKLVNTLQIIRDIKAMLGDSSATNITLPSKPVIVKSSLIEGKNQDEGYFIYEVHEGELTVSGLTEEGGRREELIIPASHNGIPVTSVGDTVFQGNTVIQRITVQENIAAIADHAFEGCSALKSVKLESSSPEKCIVGQQLLAGTEAVIVVKEEVISNYKLNYFWSTYADRIVSE